MDALVWHVESSVQGLCREFSLPGSQVSITAVQNAIAGALPSTHPPNNKDFANYAAYVACALHDCEDFLGGAEFRATSDFDNSDMTLRQAACWTAALAVAKFFDESANYAAFSGAPLKQVATTLSNLSTHGAGVPLTVVVLELEDLVEKFRQPTSEAEAGDRELPLLPGTDLRVIRSPTTLEPPRPSWFAATKVYAATWASQTYDKTPIRWRIAVLLGASALSFSVGAGVGYIAWG